MLTSSDVPRWLSIPLAGSWAELAAGVGALFAIVVAVWLAVAELRRGRREREEIIKRESYARARRIVAWVEAATSFEAGQPAGFRQSYFIFNGSGGPIYDVAVFDKEKQVVGLSVLPPAEHPQEVLMEELPPPRMRWAHAVLRIGFTDADRNRWETSEHGTTVAIPVVN
ncbi:hypothetical protein [Georgenia sp. Marseille-Q6866]